MARIVKEADERRNEILDAAETLFTEKGYSKTTIIDILNQVGIAKGTFYYYFKSKEEVMDAIIERFIEQDVQKARLIAMDKSLSPVRKICRIICPDARKKHCSLDSGPLPHPGRDRFPGSEGAPVLHRASAGSHADTVSFRADIV